MPKPEPEKGTDRNADAVAEVRKMALEKAEKARAEAASDPNNL